jgi:hypothetical protein
VHAHTSLLYFPFFFSSRALPSHSGPRPLIHFRNRFSQIVVLLGRVISSSQGRCLNTGQHKRIINAYTHQTFMPRVGFEPTIPASDRAKTIHSLDRAATVTTLAIINSTPFKWYSKFPTYFTFHRFIYFPKYFNLKRTS